MSYVSFYCGEREVTKEHARVELSRMFSSPITARSVWDLLLLGDEGAARCLELNTGIRMERDPH